MDAQGICSSITAITSFLIRVGVSETQNYPRLVQDNTKIHVNYSGFSDISVALRNVSYTDIYDYLESHRQYNIKLIDGALLQLLYVFNRRGVFLKHRLCYFPSPNYEAFQNEPELYLDESNFYADVVNRSILPVPIRIDYAPDDAIELLHPASHMTLGQYKNCRIPISSPLCPVTFVKFILNSFYNTAYLDISFSLENYIYPETIHAAERKGLHFSIE